METIFTIIKVLSFLVSIHEFWKANDERKLGFTIFWFLLMVIMGSTLSN